MKPLLILFILCFAGYGMAQTPEEKYKTLQRLEEAKKLDGNVDNLEALKGAKEVTKAKNILSKAPKGQGYKDPVTFWVFDEEEDQVGDLLKKFTQQLKLFDHMGVFAALEYLGNVKAIANERNYHNQLSLLLCVVILNLLHPLKLTNVELSEISCLEPLYRQIEFVLSNSYWKEMPIGAKKQILEKHTAIMNEIDFELQKMNKEKLKREQFSIMGFLN